MDYPYQRRQNLLSWELLPYLRRWETWISRQEVRNNKKWLETLFQPGNASSTVPHFVSGKPLSSIPSQITIIASSKKSFDQPLELSNICWNFKATFYGGGGTYKKKWSPFDHEKGEGLPLVRVRSRGTPLLLRPKISFGSENKHGQAQVTSIVALDTIKATYTW